MPQIPFVGASYTERSSNLDAQACVNLYPVLAESGTGKAIRALYGTPGTRLLATLESSGGIRGMHTPSSGDAIVVQGYSVYRVSTDWAWELVGTIADRSNPVSIADDGTRAVIVDGVSGWTLELSSNTLSQITDEAFYGASHVAFNNLRFVFNRPGTAQFYITGAGEFTFDALDFATAETNAEPIVAHLINHGELLLFKETVTEIWRDVGNPDFAYKRDGNAAIEQGCAAPHSVVNIDNTAIWLGRDANGQGFVWRLNGYTPQRISQGAIEYAIQGYDDISDAVAYGYQQEGHTFYVLTFPSANVTWTYDCKTQLWHQRAYLKPSTGNLIRHRSNCHMFFAGLHVVGDWEDGRLYALDLDYYSDDGDPMPAIRAASHVADADYVWIRHNCLQVDMETGVGLADGSTATALLDWSDDGGHTWSNQHEASIGLVGQYRARVRWNRLGRSRDRVYRLTISDPVKRVLLGATLNPGA